MLTDIPCLLMRGGTSKGPFFLAGHLPAEAEARDRVLLAVMGSPHIRQVDGIVRIVAGQTTELQSLIDWLDRFVTVLPDIIPNDFTNVFLWVVPGQLDPRTGT